MPVLLLLLLLLLLPMLLMLLLLISVLSRNTRRRSSVAGSGAGAGSLQPCHKRQRFICHELLQSKNQAACFANSCYKEKAWDLSLTQREHHAPITTKQCSIGCPWSVQCT
jgi:hypothetical protein